MKAHHGSLSRERRLQIEDDLKSGRLKGLVATSSLELGIDMGAVDLVVQVESPGAVAAGCSGSAGPATRSARRAAGKLFPKHRADLLEAAVVVERMQAGQIEDTHYPRNPIDVLCQQIVAMCALDEWTVDDLAALVRRAANFAELSDEVLASVLDLLAGRYPSEEFAELRPRIVWDRVEGIVRGRTGAQRLAVTNPGTIPDRGLFGGYAARRHPGGRARRGDGLREPPGRDVPPRRVDVAHRGHHLPEGDRHAGAGPAGEDAVLARRQARAARSSSAAPSARSPASCARRPTDPIARLRAGGPRRAGRRQPRRVPRRAGRGHRRGARRPHDRGRAVPGRDRRLAGVRAVAVRRPGARTVGDGPAAPAGRAVGRGRRAHVERRRHRDPAPRVGRRACPRTSC